MNRIVTAAFYMSEQQAMFRAEHGYLEARTVQGRQMHKTDR